MGLRRRTFETWAHAWVALAGLSVARRGTVVKYQKFAATGHHWPSPTGQRVSRPWIAPPRYQGPHANVPQCNSPWSHLPSVPIHIHMFTATVSRYTRQRATPDTPRQNFAKLLISKEIPNPKTCSCRPRDYGNTHKFSSIFKRQKQHHYTHSNFHICFIILVLFPPAYLNRNLITY